MIVAALLLAASAPIACVYHDLPADARSPNPLGLAPGPEQELSAAEMAQRIRVRAACATKLRLSRAEADAELDYAAGRITGEFLAARGNAAKLWERTRKLVGEMSPRERAAMRADTRLQTATMRELAPPDPGLDPRWESKAGVAWGVQILTAGDMLASALQMATAKDRFAAERSRLLRGPNPRSTGVQEAYSATTTRDVP